ncbi:MAG: CinA family protein [Chlamydiota bacterium]
MNLAEHILEIFSARRQTLALGESCTGGAIAASLTQIPGASQYLLGGVVAYSNKVKNTILNVEDKILQKYGAVSQQTAEAMAQGLLKTFNSDYALTVTGIAGPGGGTPEKPVGTIWLTIAHHSGWQESYLLQERGERQEIIISTVHQALLLLADKLNSD